LWLNASSGMLPNLKTKHLHWKHQNSLIMQKPFQ
jgi:hypothetical protein